MVASAEPLPRIGPAPDFSLLDQNGDVFTFRKLRGKVAIVTFIYTSCSDSCPLLTAKLVQIHKMLGNETSRVHFVEITVDPLHDSPKVLKRYAELYSASSENFSFLTGNFDQIDDVVQGFGAYFELKSRRNVDHIFLTSIVDQSGTIRVQYLGWQFDPEEFLGDIRSVINGDGRT